MAGASVVTSGEIKQQQPNSIADMLQNVPGVASEVTPNDQVNPSISAACRISAASTS